MIITIKNISMKTHHSINQMKRYHDSLRRVYIIIIAEVSNIDSELKLQMCFKTINDFVDSNELVLILLIFEAYSRIIKTNASFLIITQRATIMKRVMKNVRKYIAFR